MLLRLWFKIIILIIISVISNYATQCGLDDSQKDNFNDSLINVRRLGKKDIFVKAETSIVIWKVMQKTLRNSTEVVIMELGAKKGKRF